MTTLEEFRAKTRRLYGQCLKQYTCSNQFNSFCSEFIHKKIKIVQYKACYKHQALQILAYQFSSMGGTNHAKILMLSVKDHYEALSAELDHIEKTGLGLVILDDNNNVCLVSYFYDQCDMPSFTIKNETYHKKYEICCAAFKNDKMCQKLLSPANNISYGDILYADKAAKRPDLKGAHLSLLDVYSLFARLMGYKYVYSLQTSPLTMFVGYCAEKSSSLKNVIPFKQSVPFNFANFRFEDGTSVHDCYQKLKDAGQNVEKLKKLNSSIAVIVGFIHKSNKVTMDQALDAWFSRIRFFLPAKNKRSLSKL